MRFKRLPPALCLALALFPTPSFTAEPNDLATRCGLTLHYTASACACLAKQMPDHHLLGTIQAGNCPFQNPPPEFDPSTASKTVLESWGIPDWDAAYLHDPATRKAYYYGVKRELSGLAGGRNGTIVPASSTTWRPDNGAPCNLPAGLLLYCASWGHKVIPH
jgi:hypothetical protein